MPITRADDPLLFFTRLLLTFLLGLMLLLCAAVLVAIPILFAARDRMISRLTESGIQPEAMPWVAALLALIAVGLALGFFFIRHLRRIVDTVGSGDPFVPVNADRLRAMAWLSLGLQGLAILATPIIIWFDALPHKPNVHHNENGISFGALILALLLFVLARVFRVGAEMRAELEGTV